MSSLIICTYAKCTARERERESKRVGKMERKGSSPWRRKMKRENYIWGKGTSKETERGRASPGEQSHIHTLRGGWCRKSSLREIWLFILG